MPSADDGVAALDSLRSAGVEVEPTSDGGVVRDPWGTAVRLRSMAGDIIPRT